MGCVATLGTDPPPRSCIKCLRADAGARASPGRTPAWIVPRESRTLPPVAGASRMPALAQALGAGMHAVLGPHSRGCLLLIHFTVVLKLLAICFCLCPQPGVWMRSCTHLW